ncbi:MAG: hypothetical protein Q9216_002905 [Gyalolechia sp. 2 TL-2023]
MVYLGKRDWDDDGDAYDDGWWYSDTAEAIKWAIVAAIFLAILLFFAGGYFHAQRRMKKGQAPLRYHRQNPYEMQPYPPPPPGMSSDHIIDLADSSAYHHNEMPPPPRYEPPQGASKTNPNQQYTVPPGPPLAPPAGEASHAGPVSPISPIQEREGAWREQNAISPQTDGAQLPPRPTSSSRSWNPLKRFR